MNKILESFARQWLKENLAKLGPDQQEVFRRMYNPYVAFDFPIEIVVERMPKTKLDWAMEQVFNTLNK